MTLLLVFASTETPAPALPDLSVLDVARNSPVPVSGLQGWDEDFIQTSAMQFAPMDFGIPKRDLTIGDESKKYWCRRLSKILLSCAFSAASANAAIRIVYEDKSGNAYYGELKTFTALSSQNADSKYYAMLADFPSFGADKVWFIVESVSSGTVDIAAAGI